MNCDDRVDFRVGAENFCGGWFIKICVGMDLNLCLDIYPHPLLLTVVAPLRIYAGAKESAG